MRPFPYIIELSAAFLLIATAAAAAPSPNCTTLPPHTCFQNPDGKIAVVAASDCCQACSDNIDCVSWTATGRGQCNLYKNVGPTKTVNKGDPCVAGTVAPGPRPAPVPRNGRPNIVFLVVESTDGYARRTTLDEAHLTASPLGPPLLLPKPLRSALGQASAIPTHSQLPLHPPHTPSAPFLTRAPHTLPASFPRSSRYTPHPTRTLSCETALAGGPGRRATRTRCWSCPTSASCRTVGLPSSGTTPTPPSAAPLAPRSGLAATPTT